MHFFSFRPERAKTVYTSTRVYGHKPVRDSDGYLWVRILQYENIFPDCEFVNLKLKILPLNLFHDKARTKKKLKSY